MAKTPDTEEKILPSQFMRGLRPEYYSDTEDQAAYLLDAPTLEYHLESITSRNETHDFEVFCRKLCERTICPNLRSHTGPDGGGDSKADTETYPVSDEIVALFYVGEANAGSERWAFAFSSQKAWTLKVRNDVKGIVETGRNYNRIIFVTSRFAKDKDRARIEDELSNRYDIPVTIHDRSWIVKEIIENDRKDLAFNFLKVGEAKSDPLRLGPTDYSREQQLADIESSIDDPEIFRGIELQQVTEALVAAKLSRNIERPRAETDGRFLRAIRLADKYGTYHQKLEARYENIWTAFWWFDDFQFLNESYDSFEAFALETDHAPNLELLCNLLQLLVNSVLHRLMSQDECKLGQRTKNLKQALEEIAKDKIRPNNSLEAQTSLLIIQMNQAILNNEQEKMTALWSGFGKILEKAKNLAEFNANRLVSLVELAGQIAGNDSAYNDLVEKTAEFVSERKGEAEGALVLLKRAQKLDFSDKFEMIRFLGKAAIGLAKKEYSEHLQEALQILMFAYRSAGMLWAARASCIFLAASLVMEIEEEDQPPVTFIPTMKIWAWIALELGHLPDFLFAIQMLNGCLASLPLTEETEDKIAEDLRELDLALGSFFLNLDENELRKLQSLPDILDGLGLFMARAALLYILGYLETLRSEESVPRTEPEESIKRTFSTLASQPVAESLPRSVILNSNVAQPLRTTILGMIVEVNIQGSLKSFLIGEAVLGSLEAFFATTIEQHIIPHTEKFSINLIESSEVSKPSFEMDTLDIKANLIWPKSISPINFENQEKIHKFLTEVAGKVLAVTCLVDDAEKLLQKLFVDEAVQHRISMAAFISNSYHRVTTENVLRMSKWKSLVKKSYEIRPNPPSVPHIKLEEKEQKQNDDWKQSVPFPPKPKSHRGLSVRSVIDIHAWDQAGWRGVAYAQMKPDQPPILAFIFENEEGAKKIFERWKERFGKIDKNEEIYLSIIRNLPDQNKHHYCVQIVSKPPEAGEFKQDQIFAMPTRCHVMEPEGDTNLRRFLVSFNHFGSFFLMPAIINEQAFPDLISELAILKHKINVKLAENVEEHDIEAVALRAIATNKT